VLAVGCTSDGGADTPPASSPNATADTSTAVLELARSLVAPALVDADRPSDPTLERGGTARVPPFESRSWYVLLVEADGAVRAVRQRFDRVALHDQEWDVGDSSWRFGAVMLASGAQAWRGANAASDEPRRRRDWQQLQRAALGLAETTWSSPGDDPAYGVLTHRLDFTPGAAACQGRYRLSGAGTGAIEVRQSRCPVDGAPTGLGFTRTDSFPMPARDENGAVGVAWQRHLQGDVPAVSGEAVRFDQALLTLRGLGTLDLLRSRRSSGRGVPVVTGRLLGPEGWQAIEEVEWTMPVEGRDERVRIDSLDVVVSLSRLPLPGRAGPLPDPVDWRGAVFAHGTHHGAGFAELAAPGGRDDEA